MGLANSKDDGEARGPREREVNDPLIGERLGPYRIESLIGAGGMGLVYAGVDETLERRAAIKVLSQLSPRWVARFVAEARHQARLDHPNIVSVYGAGMDRVGGLEVHYIALKYIEGNSLAQTVRKQGPLDALQATELILDAARGLYYVHSEGFVHRDVKPSNILIDLGERALISDFGVSLKEASGDEPSTGSEFMGTWTYASPEQLDRRTVDARSDIYSLGATFQFALTGSEPTGRGGETGPEVVPHLPVDPALPPLLRFTIEQMLQTDPSQRFGSMLECIEALERAKASLASGESSASAAADESPGGPLRRESSLLVRRRWWLVAGIPLIAAAVLAVLLDSRTASEEKDGQKVAAAAGLDPDPPEDSPPDFDPETPDDPGPSPSPLDAALLQEVAAAQAELLREVGEIVQQSQEQVDPTTLFRRARRLVTGRIDQLEQRALRSGDRQALLLLDRLADYVAPLLAPVINGLEVEGKFGARSVLFDVHPVTHLQYFAFLQQVVLKDSGSFLAPLQVKYELLKDAWIEYRMPSPIRRPRFGSMLDALVAPSTTAVERFAESVGKRLPTRAEWMAVIGPALLAQDALHDPDNYDRVTWSETWSEEIWFAGVPNQKAVCARDTSIGWQNRCFRLVRDGTP
ncbi:MAG: serine/threonine-protein kinase [Planctomycetota bacterium]